MRNKIIIYLFLIISSFIHACENIFIATVPKAGTHLLAKCIQLLTDKKGVGTNTSWLYITDERLKTIDTTKEFLISHALPISLNTTKLMNKGYRGVFIYRDPRDQIISRAYMLKKNHTGPISKLAIPDMITTLMSNYPVFQSPYLHDASLNQLRNIRQHYEAYLPWRNNPMIYVTTYEKIIGSRGGGSDEIQFEEITNIAHHLGLFPSQQKIQAVADNLYGGTSTFRQGGIGDWKNHFTPYQKNLFKSIAGPMLINLEYEPNNNW